MHIKQVVTLALASSAFAQMNMPGMSEHTSAEHDPATAAAATVAESEATSQTPLMTDYPSGSTNPVSTTAAADTAAPTSEPAAATMPPMTDDYTSEVTSMPSMGNTMSTSVVPEPSTTADMGGMEHGGGHGNGTGGMTMPSATSTPEPPISGAISSTASMALLAVSVALGAFFQL